MKTRFLLFFAILTLALAGCTLADDITPPPGYVSPTPPPEVGPLYPQNAPDLANGAAIFAEKCAPCHGATGMGDGEKAAQLPVTVPTLGLAAIAQGAVPAEWYTIVTQGRMDQMMPPFTSLNDQERWDVVAYAMSLSVKPENVAAGQQVFVTTCAECHGPDGSGVANANLADPALLAKLSKNDIFRFVSKGIAPGMPGFELTLDEAARRAVADYLVSRTFGAPGALAAAATPTVAPATAMPPAAETATPAPAATDSAAAQVTPGAESATPAASPTVDASASPAATASAEASPAASATPSAGLVTINGKINNGSGGKIPTDLVVTLHGYSHDTTSGQFSEILTREAAPQSDGSFTFADVEAPVGRAFNVSVEYLGTKYGSEVLFAEDGKPTLDLPVTVYDTTTDASGLVTDQLHLLLDFSTPDVVTVIEFYVVSNPGNKSVVGASAGAPVLNFSLPQGYSNLQFQDGALGGRYLQTADGFADTMSVTPGSQQYQLAFAFDLPYTKGNFISGPAVEFKQKFNMPISMFSVLAQPGIKVEGENLADSGVQDMGGTQFQVYQSTGFAAGKTLALKISGAPQTTAAAAPAAGADNTRNILIGVAALGLVLIGLGGYLFWRDRRAQGESAADEEDEFASEDEILDAIIALEDQFKAGNISEDAYRARRAELKALLKAG
ncbi:MAG: hypothetical protein OHK0031_15880 [Anaerolineales bacterium]